MLQFLIIFIFVVCSYATHSDSKSSNLTERPIKLHKPNTAKPPSHQKYLDGLNTFLDYLLLNQSSCQIRIHVEGSKETSINLCYSLLQGDEVTGKFKKHLEEVCSKEVSDGIATCVYGDAAAMEQMVDLATQFEELIMTDHLAISHLIEKNKDFFQKPENIGRLTNFRCQMVDAIIGLETLLANLRNPLIIDDDDEENVS
eukprot:GHVL01012132.1.p1 GENE.GHVL01012132.1~~GHVL01012132.1.p1  ORF type:complete len:209 (+),score=34.45 GHVL01012132.1:29-628(+)